VLPVLLALPARGQDQPLTLAAFGDGGERGAVLRGNAGLLDNMRTGQHDGGRCGVLVLLGDMFGETGLNVPAPEVDGEVGSTLGCLRPVLQDIGTANVHAIPGETDYYARKAVEKTALFGLITMSEWPVGLSDRGVRRAAARPEWRFHAREPAAAVYAAGDGTRDSVELLFFDSALLMRTSPASWTPVLDSLRSLLRSSAARPGVGWRILCTHHPLRSVGEHAGYTVWNDEDSTVERVNACDKDSNAFGFVRNWIDPEDLCTDRYREYGDSLRSIIALSGARVQVVLSAHDRSLQILEPGDGLPVQIVSGCGSGTACVRLPVPPLAFTAGRKLESGRSLPGLVQLRWENGGLTVVFYNERNGERVAMGGGRTSFLIDKQGALH
jgi:hypothetical protein